MNTRYGRGDKIRTCDFYVPNVALYQAEPHLDYSILSFGKLQPCDFYVPNGRALRGCAHTKLSHTSIAYSYIISLFCFLVNLFYKSFAKKVSPRGRSKSKGLFPFPVLEAGTDLLFSSLSDQNKMIRNWDTSTTAISAIG